MRHAQQSCYVAERSQLLPRSAREFSLYVQSRSIDVSDVQILIAQTWHHDGATGRRTWFLSFVDCWKESEKSRCTSFRDPRMELADVSRGLLANQTALAGSQSG
jgi:hypothetical protein